MRGALAIHVGVEWEGWGCVENEQVQTYRAVVGAEAGVDCGAHKIQVALLCPVCQRLVTRTWA